MGMGFKYQMGMGMKSLKWEGFGTKILFPHISRLYLPAMMQQTIGHRLIISNLACNIHTHTW